MFSHIEKEKDLRHSRKAQKAIAAKKGEIQCTIVKGKGKVHTPLWKNFVESYTLDLEVGSCCSYLM